MEHTKNFYKYKDFYDSGMWSKEKLHHTVNTKLGITEAEYFEITHEVY